MAFNRIRRILNKIYDKFAMFYLWHFVYTYLPPPFVLVEVNKNEKINK
jgi:hypothetical protein